MAIAIEEILRKDAFRSLDQTQREALIRTMADIHGKSAMEAMPHIMNFAAVMKKSRPMTTQEQSAMMAAFMESLPEADQSKFKSILKLMENRF